MVKKKWKSVIKR